MNRLVLLVAILMMSSQMVQAQTVRFETETKFKLHMLGAVGNMLGKKAMVTTTYVSPYHMRTEDDRNVTVLSIPDEKMISMDTKKKRYYEMTFEEMASMMSAASNDAQQRMDDAGMNDEDMDNGDLQFDVSVTDMGESESILGYRANRKLVRIDVAFTAESTDDEGNTETASGNLYTISDLWISEDAAGHEVMEAFGKNYAEVMGETFGANNRFAALQQVFQQDGRIGPAMEKMQQEMQQLEGVPLRSTMYMVMAPEGVELDVDAVLNPPEKEKKKGGLGRLARGALKNSGINVGSSNDDAAEQQEVNEQSVLLTTETIYKMMETVEDDPGRYTPPSKYKLVDAPKYPGMDN